MSWRSGWTVLMVLLMVSVMVSCTLFSSESDGVLVISYGGMGRAVWEPDADDMEIASYRINLVGPGSFGTVSAVHNMNGGEGNTFIFDGLSAGEYLLEIEGYRKEDAQGEVIAVLRYRDGDNGVPVRNIAVTVLRSQISTVHAVLVPHVDDTVGSLEITEVLFRGAGDSEFDKNLLQNNPRIIIDMHHLASADLNVQDEGSYLYALVDEESSELSVSRNAEGNDVRFVHELSSSDDQGPEDIGDESSPALTVTNLPSGWYRMTVELQGGYDVRIWKRAVFVRILDITDDQGAVKPTRGVLTVRDFMLESGSLVLDITHDMEHLPVDISGPDSAVLGYAGSSTEAFSAEGSFSSPIYSWFINGDYVGDDSVLEYTFTESGSFCITVMVHDEGRWGAASVTAEVYQYVVGKPGQGGIVFYDKGYYSDSWRYLEVSAEDVSDSADWHSAGPLCTSFDGAGFEDWYLPTKDDLFAVYEQLHLQDIGDFAEAYYWSSDELNDGFAWSQSFITGGFQVSTGDPIVNNQFSFSKDSTRRVRAVRAF